MSGAAEGGGGELEAPLLSGGRRPSEGASRPGRRSTPEPGPRILDREGRFRQSRGRWSVVNTDRGVRNRRGAAAGGCGDGGGDGDASQPATTFPNTFQRTPHQHASKPKNRPCCLPASNTPRSCWDDWFHSVSYTPTALLLLLVFLAYSCTVVAFAGLYYSANKMGVRYGHSSSGGEGSENPPVATLVGTEEGVESFCGMDINNFMEALYFSLSTMATIGYGTSDYYFGNCWTPFLLVLLQVFAALVFSSVAIGLIFQRMSRGQKRGRTIVFSDVSVLRKVRGRWYWMFRAAELRKRHIIGAKVRAFCVRHERCPVGEKAGGGERGGEGTVELETAHFVSHPLSILGGGGNGSPDEYGRGGNPSPGLSSSATGEKSPRADSAYEQSILMGLPHVVVHRMDDASPMMPPRPIWYDEEGSPHGPGASKEREESIEAGSSLSVLEEGSSTRSVVPSQEEVSLFLQDRQAEIIVFLEGTCEVTGMTLQARHSYRIEDIAFNHTFAPCVFPAPTRTGADSSSKRKWWRPFDNSKAKVDDFTEHESLVSLSEDAGYNIQSPALEVDFGQFHDLMPAPLDCMSCPYVPSATGRES